MLIYEYTNTPMDLTITNSRCIPYYAIIIILVILVGYHAKYMFIPFMYIYSVVHTSIKGLMYESLK